MTNLSPEAKAFLFELYACTGTDLNAQVSMYDVGQTLGMEKNDAASMAESLYIEGLAELKTLSGGIGITREGLSALDIKSETAPDTSLSLGTAMILDEQGRACLDLILPEIKIMAAQTRLEYPVMEEILMDIKTMEVQMLSPKPKTAVIREVLKSIQGGCEASGAKDLAQKLKNLTS